jgi:hypothetical protein
MFQSDVFTLFLLSLVQHSTHGSPIQPRSANGPVITTNFMDPSVIQLKNGYYAFAGANGNPAGINVQVAYSPDFSSWTVNSGYDALPVLGAWAANPGHVWSPDINELVRILRQLKPLSDPTPLFSRLAVGLPADLVISRSRMTAPSFSTTPPPAPPPPAYTALARRLRTPSWAHTPLIRPHSSVPSLREAPSTQTDIKILFQENITLCTKSTATASATAAPAPTPQTLSCRHR